MNLFAEDAALLPTEISSQEWADFMGMDLDEFAAWHEDEFGFYDDEYPVHSRAFAYGRIISEWRGYARFMLDELMNSAPHPSHVFMYEQAKRYLLKIEAIELIAECEEIDLSEEIRPSDADDVAAIAAILANPDAIAARLDECRALQNAANVSGGAA